MATMELVRPERQDEEDGRVPKVPDQEREEIARRTIGPVHALDHECERSSGRHPLEHAEKQLEETALRRPDAEPGGRGLVHHGAEIGNEPGQLRASVTEDRVELVGSRLLDEPAQCLDDRRKGNPAVAQVDAAAREDLRARTSCPLGEVRDEARLADARPRR